eukprot:TRINITY_DN12809_c0_g1_i1.p1 TRINITY_DN12809_c0_g1~~TRINITY_DN12809_c0_g1_i1.p1  ORF type:complete len:477 (-),score=70.58 TRINITY_DN12809_c0_g1_i1:35-1465(-)
MGACCSTKKKPTHTIEKPYTHLEKQTGTNQFDYEELQRRESLDSKIAIHPLDEEDTAGLPQKRNDTSQMIRGGGYDQPTLNSFGRTQTNKTNENLTKGITQESPIRHASSSSSFAYKKGEKIGSGSFGNVYQCLDLNTGQLLAAKEIKLSGDPQKVEKEVLALRDEILLLKQLNHKNIVKYYTTEICEDNAGVDIITEYVPGGSLKSLLGKFGKLQEKVASIYTGQILEGLSYLHSHNVVHRDIKGANVLIHTDGTIKLTDFGASKRIKKIESYNDNPQDIGQDALCKSLKGSPYWMAPEIAKQIGYGSPADVWSVGGVVIEMLTGAPPWSSITKSLHEVFNLLLSGKTPPFPTNISPICYDFLQKTLRVNPSERPSALELLEHPFIKEPGPDQTMQTLNEHDMVQSSYNPMRFSGEVNPYIIPPIRNKSQVYTREDRDQRDSDVIGKVEGQQRDESTHFITVSYTHLTLPTIYSV